MAELDPTSPEQQLADALSASVRLGKPERMSGAVDGAREAASLLLHNYEVAETTGEEISPTPPEVQATDIITDAIRNKTLRRLLGDITDAA